MAHLFSILTNDPEHTRCQLQRLGERVRMGDSQALGVGSYGDDDVLLAKRPGPAQSTDVALMTRDLRSAAVVAVAHGPGFVFEEKSADPFRFRRWLFAMDGQVDGYSELRETLGGALLPFISRQLGDTDREQVFGLFLSELKAEARLEDPDVTAPEAALCLGRALHKLDALAGERGQTRPSPLAAVASNGRLLVAVRRGRPLHYALIEGMAACSLCKIDESTPELNPLKAEHRRCKAVVLATEPADSGHFIEVPESSLVAVSRTLALMVSAL